VVVLFDNRSTHLAPKTSACCGMRALNESALL
jgi:hypothetical protein